MAATGEVSSLVLNEVCDEPETSVVDEARLQEEDVQFLREENTRLASKVRGHDTLTTLFGEARLQVAKLRKQLRCKEGIVYELQSRLASYEPGTISVGAEGLDQPLVSFGPSRSLVESLVLEVASLKRCLHELGPMPREADGQHLQCRTSGNVIGEKHLSNHDQQLEGLSNALTQEKKEVARLYNILHMVDEERAAELMRLRQRVLEQTRYEKAQREQFDSLVIHNRELQARLAAAAVWGRKHDSQDLDTVDPVNRDFSPAEAVDHRVEEERDLETSTPNEIANFTGRDSKGYTSAQHSWESVSWGTSLGEVEVFEQQEQEAVKHLRISEEKRQQEIDICVLVNKIGDFQDALLQKQVAQDDLQRKLHAKCLECERQAVAISREGATLKREMNKVQVLEEKCQSLREALHTLQEQDKTPSPLPAEMILMYEQQIQVCREDFESERQDRERAQARVEQLEQENIRLKQLVTHGFERRRRDVGDSSDGTNPGKSKKPSGANN
uniref:Uncharacterized protein n=1 Tax=Eptatretus burgeri TaxID=7764 RepID=A0A8C4QBM3_EPTBU